MISKNDIESKSLEISEFWRNNGFLRETNDYAGVCLSLDWKSDGDNYYIVGVNTNIDLSDLESKNFKFDRLVEFFNKNDFTHILGLTNIDHSDNPSSEFKAKLKSSLDSSKIDYDEYIIDSWPAPIPKFYVPKNVFIMRYSFDPNGEIDSFAANDKSFKNWIDESKFKKLYWSEDFQQFTRVIVLCSDVDSLVLSDGYSK